MSINSFPNGTVDRSIGRSGTRATHGISLRSGISLLRLETEREKAGKVNYYRAIRDTKSISRDHRAGYRVSIGNRTPLESIGTPLAFIPLETRAKLFRFLPPFDT